ncbi:MAG TPA: cytochrome c [Xanthobacteraceae bacterium]|nr:cytochrome c [Xanthobacteraceae bacterium]
MLFEFLGWLTMILRPKRLLAPLALLSLLIASCDAMALSAAEKRGRTLAVRLCAQCHAIGKTDASPRRDAPLLRHLGERVDLDTFQARLRGGLMSGHHEMPAFRFSREDAHAFVSYLRSIQKP